jgi:hypothetical protein
VAASRQHRIAVSEIGAPVTSLPKETFFFVHVMKTAGLTLGQHIDANFPPQQRYPTPGDRPVDYMVITSLREAVEARRDQVRLWRGHFPFFVTSLVPEAITMSIVRDPVARTISMLAQYRLQNAPDLTLEAVYDDEYVQQRMLGNHQTKVFAMTEEDAPGTYLKPIDVDERRLAVAKKNLERVDLLGLTERFPDFLRDLSERHGWRIDDLPRVNVGEPVEIPRSLRRRIVADTLLDAELYEHACQLVG